MSLQEFKQSIPSFAKDIKLNLGQILSEQGSPGLSASQIWGIALSCAFITKDAELITMVSEESQSILSEDHRHAAKSAVSIMAMNNIYYRFVHQVQDDTYAQLPAKLRMMIIGNPGIDKLDFEMYCLAVSAINGCGMCMDSHRSQLENAGISKEGVQSVIRIAAVVHAAGTSRSIDHLTKLS